MATIGTLLAELHAETASFRQDLGKAAQHLQSFEAKTNRLLASMERRWQKFNVIAGAAIGGWIAKMAFDGVMGALSFAEAIGDTSRAIGLGTDALQQYRYALQQNGASVADTDAALLKFSQTIGDAANGSRTAQEALARIGITTDDLKSKSLDQLFGQATNNLSRFASEADRNSAIVDVFGKGALKMAGALAMSADEMANLRAEAVRAGAVLSADTIARAKETKDRFEALSNVIRVQFTEALVNAGPIIVQTGKFLADLAGMANWALQRMGAIPATLDQQYDLLLQKRMDAAERIAQLEKRPSGTRFSVELEKEKQRLTEIDAQLTSLRDKLAKKPQTPTGTPAAKKVETPKEYLSLIHDLEKATEKSHLAVLTSERDKVYATMAMERDEFIFKAKQQKLWVEDGKKATAEQIKVREAFQKWLIAAEQEAAFKARTPMQQLNEQWQNTTRMMQEATTRWANSATDALTEFVMTGKLSFSDFANSIIRDLVRIYIQKRITGPLFESMESGGLFSGIGKIFGFAEGGNPPVGVPSIVGERGPELFVPKTSGTIVPNDRLAMGGGTYYIDARGADQAGFESLKRLIVSLDGSIERRAVGAWVDAKRRGMLPA